MVTFDLKVHYQSECYTIGHVDPDEYSYICLMNDICLLTPCQSERSFNLMLQVYADVNDGLDVCEITSDADVMRMFSLNEGKSTIYLFVMARAIQHSAKHGTSHTDNCTPISQVTQAGPSFESQVRDGFGVGIDGLGNSLGDGMGEGLGARVGCEGGDGLGKELRDEIGEDGDGMGDEEFFAFSDDDEDWMPDDNKDAPCSPYSVHMGDIDSDHDSDHDGNELSDYHSNSDDHMNSSDSNSDSDCVVDPTRGMKGRRPQDGESGKLKFAVGDTFPSISAFREKLRDYVIQEGFDLKRVNNEKKRVRCKCAAPDCEWVILASPTPNFADYVVRTLNDKHNCVRASTNRNATSTWIAKKFESRLRANPNMKVDGMREELVVTYGVEVSNMQLYRARKQARDVIEGNHGKSYAAITLYAEMVRKYNPGSLVKLQCDRISLDHSPTFKRFFVSFDAMRKGFLEGCRPFLGVDGCHLKGPFGGVLLAAVGLDANSGLYPVAIAIVESENKDSWSFFIHHLHTIIGINNQWRKVTFMTDRQKGVGDAITDIIPEASHRVCCRHLYNNFKAKYPGLLLRDHFWAAARAFNVHTFKKAMDDIKAISAKAHEWLSKVPPSQWSRHAFDACVKNDHLTNNMTESFNSWLGELREKPVLTLLESVRCKLMRRLCNRYEKATTWESFLTPNTYKKLDVLKQQSRKCSVMYAGRDEFQVVESYTSYIVDLGIRHCSCGAWEICGIPCKHIVACVTYKRANLDDYCDAYFTKDAYFKAHTNIIHPIPDQKEWPTSCQYNPISPPPLRRLPGRPKKNRKRAADEPAPSDIRKRASTVKCNISQQFGHNKRTCQRAPVGSNPRPSSQVGGMARCGAVSGSRVGAVGGKHVGGSGARGGRSVGAKEVRGGRHGGGSRSRDFSGAGAGSGAGASSLV